MVKALKARITGMGSYLPERILTNFDLEKMVDTSDEWISSRTGMKERRIAAKDESTSDMAAKAAEKALADSGIDPKEIELILVATVTPDHILPSTAALVQSKIGAANAAAVDMQAACTGYIYALSAAKAYIESGMHSNILVIASDKMSSILDYKDRNTCVLFGDGAAAALVTSQGPGFAINSVCLGADGGLADLISVPSGGSRCPTTHETIEQNGHFVKMAGKETFKHAVRRMGAAVKKCLEEAGMNDDQISWFIPHQANERIIDTLAKKFQIPLERVAKTLHKYGNTSASSIAITLDELSKEKTIHVDDHLLLVAFGAGLTWGASILTKIGE